MEPHQREKIFLPLFLLCCRLLPAGAASVTARYTPPSVPRLTDAFPHISFAQGFSPSYGGANVKLADNGSFASLALDRSSGSGMVSRKKYNSGFFSAAIRLPPGFTSGVVVAFYLSNSDAFPHNHDEIDIELLGHERGREWVLQTNMYGNGDVKTGREEKFRLWFDPSQYYHHYSVIWNSHHIVFLVDSIPVREVVRGAAIASAYPAKPMSVHATIWDGSQWATRGGKYPVDYRYAPFVASFGEMEMEGCAVMDNPKAGGGLCSKGGSPSRVEGGRFVKLSPQQTTGLQWARRKLMFYSYCTDSTRFKVPPPECHS